jgi:hypothetical protein
MKPASEGKLPPLVLAGLGVACAINAAPAVAQLESPEAASRHIDELSKEVYRPGNAKKANEDLDAFWRELGEKLRGFERSLWGPIGAEVHRGTAPYEGIQLRALGQGARSFVAASSVASDPLGEQRRHV